MSGLAMTLRQTDPGTRVRMQMRDGSEVSGTIGDVNGESVMLGDGGRIELRQVLRIVLEFGELPSRRAA